MASIYPVSLAGWTVGVALAQLPQVHFIDIDIFGPIDSHRSVTAGVRRRAPHSANLRLLNRSQQTDLVPSYNRWLFSR